MCGVSNNDGSVKNYSLNVRFHSQSDSCMKVLILDILLQHFEYSGAVSKQHFEYSGAVSKSYRCMYSVNYSHWLSLNLVNFNGFMFD